MRGVGFHKLRHLDERNLKRGLKKEVREGILDISLLSHFKTVFKREFLGCVRSISEAERKCSSKLRSSWEAFSAGLS